MNRQSFFHAAAAAFPIAAMDQDAASRARRVAPVRAGRDRLAEARSLGINSIAYKVLTRDAEGGLFVLEQTSREKGGPARHLHHEQDEWFYVLEGEYLFEVGDEKLRLTAGDSLLAPRKVPHVWAYVGEGGGRFLVAFAPAGLMEAFFREITRVGAMPPQDPKLWRDHGMELLGPPLAVR